MRDVAKALLTLFYAGLFIVFVFLVMVSLVVALGLIGDNYLLGIFCMVVFWIAAAKYRKMFIERVENVQKSIQDTDDHDDESDDSI